MSPLNYQHVVELNTQVYPIEVIYRVCYIFTDDFYLYMRPGEGNKIFVEITSKNQNDFKNDVVGSFLNALIDHRVRFDISKNTKNIREVLIGTAFGEAKENKNE